MGGAAPLPRGGHSAVLVGDYLLLLGGCVESMFYYPDRVRYETPDALGLRYERVRFQSTDGTALSGWFIPAAGRADPRERHAVHVLGTEAACWCYVFGLDPSAERRLLGAE